MIVRTILAFEESPLISEIIIAARKEEMIKYKLFAQTYGFQKVKAVVRGGDNRQESAFNSLRKLNTQCDYILIHDGARPFVSQQNIADTIKAAQNITAPARPVMPRTRSKSQTRLILWRTRPSGPPSGMR